MGLSKWRQTLKCKKGVFETNLIGVGGKKLLDELQGFELVQGQLALLASIRRTRHV